METKPESIYREGLFEGRVALITGGGSGIGKSIAFELGRLGARVVIAARKVERILVQRLTRQQQQGRFAGSQRRRRLGDRRVGNRPAARDFGNVGDAVGVIQGGVGR